MKRADKQLWLSAMEDELSALQEQGTWQIVPRPQGRKIISTKWVLRIKWNPEKTVPLYKARLCARGFTQVYGVDFDETYSPTLSKAGLRLILAVAVQLGMHIHSVDCKNAFLNGEIDRDIYLEQPAHFIAKGTTAQSHVCKLVKALYGLKQSPLIWNHTLRDSLKEKGFEQLEGEPCIFVKRGTIEGSNKRSYNLLKSWKHIADNEDFCILGIYVDDITIVAKTTARIQEAKDIIGNAFKIKDEGEITKIVGIEIKKVNNGILLHQEGSIRNMLQKQFMENCNGNRIPMDSTAVQLLTGNTVEQPIDNSWYRSIVGEMLYLTVCTRPDISFAVNLCARNVETPTENNKKAITKILRYLKTTMNHGLLYQKCVKNLGFVVHSDSDFATDRKDSKSTTGYVISLNNCVITWKTTKQKAVSTSTVEAEYIAACAAVKEVIWLNHLLTEILGVEEIQTPLLLLDNSGAESLIQNDEMSNKVKHIRYSNHFIRDCHAHKLINIRHIAGTENPADMFTKPLGFESFRKHCQTLNVGNSAELMLKKEFSDRGYLAGSH